MTKAYQRSRPSSSVDSGYRESRAHWRKLWRKELDTRRVHLSHHALGTIYRLLTVADDAGCLGEVSARGHAARLLAQRIGIRPSDRKGFYRDVDELLEYGDDGEPLALVIHDGNFYLTRFEECQANRRRDDTGTTLGQQASANPRKHTTPKQT